MTLSPDTMHALALLIGGAIGSFLVQSVGTALVVLAGKHDTAWGQLALRFGNALLAPKPPAEEPKP